MSAITATPGALQPDDRRPKPKDIFDADAAEIEIVMPSSPTESESSTTAESTLGCSSHSHHDGSHARHGHGHGHGHSESVCCGPGSSRRRARAVTAFINVSFRSLFAFLFSLLGSDVMRSLPNRTHLRRFVAGCPGCRLCGALNNASRSTCAIDWSLAPPRVRRSS